MEELFAEGGDIRLENGDTRVGQSPYDEGGERQIAAQGPKEGQIAFAQVELPGDISEAEVVGPRQERP